MRQPDDVPGHVTGARLSLLAGLLIFAASVALAFYAASVQAAPLSGMAPAASGPAVHLFPVLAFIAAVALGASFFGLFSRQTSRAENESTACADTLQFSRAASNDSGTRTGFEDRGVGMLDYPEFCEALQRHWENCRRQSSYLALAAVEIDDYCVMSDAFGHQQIEQLVIQMAQSLHSLVLAHGGILARHNSNQFLVLFPNTTPDEALQTTEDLSLSVEDLGFARPAPSRGVITASSGLCISVPSGDLNPEQLLSAATDALDRARCHGPGHVEAEILQSSLILRG